MGTITIDGRKVEFTDEKNLLTVIRKAGIDIPTLCYHSELSTFGACRLCTVEDDRGRTFASCSEEPRDGMVIYTNSGKIKKYRKLIVELLLAAHCRDCTTCVKSGECVLQELAHRLGVHNIRFQNTREQYEIDDSSPSLIRDPNKCILCGDCVRVCNEIQHVGAIDFANRGSKMIISTAFGRDLADTNCVNCGQCAAVCPTGAITIKNDTHDVWEAIHDPKKRVVMQIAPAVRVAIGEAFGYEPGENTIGKLIASLRKLGVDAIFDTSVGADLTIMEESAELVETLSEEGRKYPLFTSCCPGWIRFVETKYPHLMKYVSTSKSPMEMFGAVIKEYYKKLDKEEGKETVSVAIMPCTAKKYEASREEFVRNSRPDVDYVLTSEEVIGMFKEIGIRFDRLEPEAYDMPFSIYSGAGVIFGATGGVTEAAVRRVVADKSPKALKDIEFIGTRGMAGTKICELDLGERTVRIGIVSGLGNAEELIKKIESGEEHFDFVEVMACPGGCVGGGGQPIHDGEERAFERGKNLYYLDRNANLRFSHENPDVIQMYKEYFEAPMSHKAHMLLHTEHKKNM